MQSYFGVPPVIEVTRLAKYIKTPIETYFGMYVLIVNSISKCVIFYAINIIREKECDECRTGNLVMKLWNYHPITAERPVVTTCRYHRSLRRCQWPTPLIFNDFQQNVWRDSTTILVLQGGGSTTWGSTLHEREVLACLGGGWAEGGRGGGGGELRLSGLLMSQGEKWLVLLRPMLFIHWGLGLQSEVAWTAGRQVWIGDWLLEVSRWPWYGTRRNARLEALVVLNMACQRACSKRDSGPIYIWTVDGVDGWVVFFAVLDPDRTRKWNEERGSSKCKNATEKEKVGERKGPQKWNRQYRNKNKKEDEKKIKKRTKQISTTATTSNKRKGKYN